jgi:hypothetical protein
MQRHSTKKKPIMQNFKRNSTMLPSHAKVVMIEINLSRLRDRAAPLARISASRK